jgi:hypothetical protein
MSADLYRPYVDGPIKYASVAVAASGDNTLVTAVDQKKIRLLSATLVAAGTVAVQFKSGAATDLSGAMTLVANNILPLAPCTWGHLETAEGEDLVLELSAAIGVNGLISYLEIPTGPA